MKKIQAVSDPRGHRVMWGVQTATGGSDSTLLDSILVYDYSLDRWALLDVDVRVMFSTSLPAASLDDGTDSMDDTTLPSLDSAAFAGGEPALAAFGVDNKMAFFEGDQLEAILETPDFLAARPNQAFVNGVRVDTDAPAIFTSVAARQSLADTVLWKPETEPNRRRFCPTRARGRYHRARIRIPASTAWTYISGVEVNPKGLGQ